MAEDRSIRMLIIITRGKSSSRPVDRFLPGNWSVETISSTLLQRLVIKSAGIKASCDLYKVKLRTRLINRVVWLFANVDYCEHRSVTGTNSESMWGAFYIEGMFYCGSRMCHRWVGRYPGHLPHGVNITGSWPGSARLTNAKKRGKETLPYSIRPQSPLCWAELELLLIFYKPQLSDFVRLLPL